MFIKIIEPKEILMSIDSWVWSYSNLHLIFICSAWPCFALLCSILRRISNTALQSERSWKMSAKSEPNQPMSANAGQWSGLWTAHLFSPSARECALEIDFIEALGQGYIEDVSILLRKEKEVFHFRRQFDLKVDYVSGFDLWRQFRY